MPPGVSPKRATGYAKKDMITYTHFEMNGWPAVNIMCGGSGWIPLARMAKLAENAGFDGVKFGRVLQQEEERAAKKHKPGTEYREPNALWVGLHMTEDNIDKLRAPMAGAFGDYYYDIVSLKVLADEEHPDVDPVVLEAVRTAMRGYHEMERFFYYADGLWTLPLQYL